MRHHHFGCRHERRRHRAAMGLASVASIAAAILASGCHDGRRDERERGEDGRAQARVERALDWLDLEGDARERARIVGLRLADEAGALRRDGTQLATELIAQWRSATPDGPALHGALDREIDGLRARAHRALDDVLELHAILDDEQRAEVGDLLAARGPESGRRHRHRW